MDRSQAVHCEHSTATSAAPPALSNCDLTAPEGSDEYVEWADQFDSATETPDVS